VLFAGFIVAHVIRLHRSLPRGALRIGRNGARRLSRSAVRRDGMEILRRRAFVSPLPACFCAIAQVPTHSTRGGKDDAIRQQAAKVAIRTQRCPIRQFKSEANLLKLAQPSMSLIAAQSRRMYQTIAWSLIVSAETFLAEVTNLAMSTHLSFVYTRGGCRIVLVVSPRRMMEVDDEIAVV